MPKIVRIREGCKHGRGDRPEGQKKAGDLYVASEIEIVNFSDKFAVLSDDEAREQISGFIAEKVVSLAEGDENKARCLIAVEGSGRGRKGVVDALGKIIKSAPVPTE